MKGYNQNNPHHCYDLLNHTIQTVLSIPDENLSNSDFINLRIAALFHDIGKPETAFDKNGRTVFYEHAKKSAEIALSLLPKMKVPSNQMLHIIFFIEQHDVFISFKPKNEIFNYGNPYIKEINEYNVKEKIKEIQDKYCKEGKYIPNYNDFYALMYLCKADALSQSDTVVQQGRIIDSRNKKTERLTSIQNIIKTLI